MLHHRFPSEPTHQNLSHKSTSLFSDELLTGLPSKPGTKLCITGPKLGKIWLASLKLTWFVNTHVSSQNIKIYGGIEK